jgi:hypothetical protein
MKSGKSMYHLLNIIIIVFIAILGLDRINFFGSDNASFNLTPFLLLSPIIFFLILFDFIIRKKHIIFPKNFIVFFSIVNFLLLTILCSVLFSTDIYIGIKRSILLFILIYTNIIVCLYLFNIDSYRRNKLLLYGSYLGIFLSLLFDIGQILVWFSILDPTSFSIVNLVPPSYGQYAPRFSGLSGDMNRGGMLILIYMFFIYKLASPSHVKNLSLFLGSIMILFTLSRSVILSAIVIILIEISLRKKIKPISIVKTIIFTLLLIFILIAIFNMINIDQYFNYQVLLQERMDFSSKESGGTHIELIKKGFDIATDSIKNFVFGIGFGNAYTVLDSIFGANNKYANFHSLYISFLTECGIFSLLIMIILLCYPLLKFRYFSSLILGIITFNIFYQIYLDPYFWFFIFFIWLNSTSLLKDLKLAI